MRQKSLIKEGSPCDIDYADKSIQSLSDAKAIGPVFCSNRNVCLKRNSAEGIQCYRQVAQQMAGYIMGRNSSLHQAVQEEKQEYLEQGPDGEFWVFQNGKWRIVHGKEKIMNDVIKFIHVMIDSKPGERRPFTKDGKRLPEIGLDDAMHNAMLDLDDVYGEVGQKNPLRG